MAAKILIIDDDFNACDILKLILQKEGFEVHAQESAEEGLEELKTNAYDLILLDINFPGMSGMEACRLIRQDDQLARLPVIMLTALRRPIQKVQGLDAGADDYIVKPPKPDELIARINALLRRHHKKPNPDKPEL